MRKLISEIFLALLVVCFAIAQTKADDTPLAPTTADADDEVYNGVYNDKQIFPNLMASLCKIKAEDAVKDNNKLYKCVNQLVIKATNKNAATSDEGKKDIDAIRAEQLKIMLALATSKAAAIANYNDPEDGIMKKLDEANQNEQTEHDDNAAVVNTNATLSALINDMRDLYAENLKYMAISNIQTISKDVIEDYLTEEEKAAIEEEEKKKAEVSNTGNDVDQTTIKKTYTTEEPYVTQWRFVENNQCERKVCTGETMNGTDDIDLSKLQCLVETGICPDGTYFSPNDSNIAVICSHGVCNEVTDMNIDGEFIDATFKSGNTCLVRRKGIAGEVTNEEPCPYGTYDTTDGKKVDCGAGVCSAPYNPTETTDTEDGGTFVGFRDGQCWYHYTIPDDSESVGPCPDGDYPISDGLYLSCVGGECTEQLGNIGFTAPTGGSSSTGGETSSNGLGNFLNSVGLNDYVSNDGSVSLTSIINGVGGSSFFNNDGSINIGSVMNAAGLTVSSNGTVSYSDLIRVAGVNNGSGVDLNKLLQAVGADVTLPSNVSTIKAEDLKKITSSNGEINVNDLMALNLNGSNS